MTHAALDIQDLVVDLRGAGRVLHGVSLRLDPGETLALLGPSGCGKTTLARAVLRLIEPTSGDILLEGTSLLTCSKAQLLQCRRRLQAVFQDPGGSLNERMRVADVVGEPLQSLRGVQGEPLRKRVASLLESVGLQAKDAARWPHQFSGGEKQRIAIARALSVEPSVLICDEPTSSLDVSVQAHILNLLGRLQQERNMAMLMVTHDIAVAGRTCDRIAVMDQGRIVEDRPARELIDAPEHAMTCALLEAVA